MITCRCDECHGEISRVHETRATDAGFAVLEHVLGVRAPTRSWHLCNACVAKLREIVLAALPVFAKAADEENASQVNT